MGVDLATFAVGGAQRPDSFSGMDPQFASSLASLFADAPANIRQGLQVSSGFRSNDVQSRLWTEALKKYGSADAARKWVAPPGKSKHNHGHAADLKFLNDTARQWVHQNATKYGLAFPLANENWHVELAGARGQPMPSAAPTPTAPAPAAALGDLVAPQPAIAANPIGDAVSAFRQSQQQREAEDAERQSRRQALLGGLGGFYA